MLSRSLTRLMETGVFSFLFFFFFDKKLRVCIKMEIQQGRREMINKNTMIDYVTLNEYMFIYLLAPHGIVRWGIRFFEINDVNESMW